MKSRVPMQWFRLYAEVRNDPKVQLLKPPLFKAWINFMCFACEHNGYLPSPSEIAWGLRVTEHQVSSWTVELMHRGLIEDTQEGLYLHNWDGRQFLSDNSAERVKEYRHRLRAAGGVVGGHMKHRDAVLKRDGGNCVYCGSEKNLCLDHAVPVLLGGDDDPMNLVTCCKSCSAKKGGRAMDQTGMSFIDNDTRDLYRMNVERLVKLGKLTVIADGIQVIHGVTETEKTHGQSPNLQPICHGAVTLPEQSRAEQSRAEQSRGRDSVTDSPNSGDQTSAAARVSERMYALHPKKRNMALVLGALVVALKNGATLSEIESCHAAWCASKQWTEENGRFAPKLDEWLADRGFTIWPPRPRKSKAQAAKELMESLPDETDEADGETGDRAD